MIRKCIYTVGGGIIMLAVSPIIIHDKLINDGKTSHGLDLANSLIGVLGKVTKFNKESK